jgi:GMP synthase-like glutamine amidotransferase
MTPTLRLCLVDMNNGHANQASRCFAVLVDDFFAKVKARNPQIHCEFSKVEPRNKGELPSDSCDFYLSSGGPGGPFDHDGDPFYAQYRSWVDGVVDENLRNGAGQPSRSVFAVCYSFEVLVRHFGVATMQERARRRFGVMPVYTTSEGMSHPLTGVFDDRLFAFEQRSWEAVGLEERTLRELGGKLLAQESRDGKSKGQGLLAFDFAPGVLGTIFHPEADKPGVVAWLSRRDQAEAFIDAYGAVTYERMISTLDNPSRLAKTFTQMLPGWLVRKFNTLAEHRGWRLLDMPTVDLQLFSGDAPAAATVAYPSLLPPPSGPEGKSGSVPKIALKRLDFDDTDMPLDPYMHRPLDEKLDPSVSDESQGLLPGGTLVTWWHPLYGRTLRS